MALGSSIAGLFGKSPIKPLQAHYSKVHDCTAALSSFFKAVVEADWPAAGDVQQQIATLENEADELKKQFRLGLPKSLFLPMPREDLLDMVSMQDRIANRAKDIAGLMLGRKMHLPAEISAEMLAYVDTAIAASAQTFNAINELDELVETGFGGREVKLIETMIDELDRIERLTDDQQVAIRARLYQVESNLPPVDVMFLYKIIDYVGDLADRAQKVGGFLHMLLAR